MYTLKDIAEKAGVSHITVSRVVNNYPHISEKTKRKVMEVIKEIDYTPNQVARSLVTKRTKTLGLLLSNISNPFYPSFVLGAEHRARELGYTIIICNADTCETAMHNLDVLIQKQVDSFLITSLEFTGDECGEIKKFYRRIDELSIDLEKKDIYFCLFNSYVNNGVISMIFGDNRLGAKMATEHLYTLGHRDIALIIGKYDPKGAKNNADFWSMRYEGYLSVLTQKGIPVNSRNIFVCNEDKAEDGYSAAKKILELSPRPTAVFAANDNFAIGAISAFHEAGLKLPEEVSVVGIDGIEEGQIIYPKLTTVSLQREKLGREAIEHLINRIERKSNAQDIIIKPVLKIGQSAVKPNQRQIP